MPINTVAVTLDSLVCPICGRREVYTYSPDGTNARPETDRILHVYCDTCGFGGQGNWSVGADAGMKLDG